MNESEFSPRDLVIDGNFDERIGTNVSLMLPNVGAVSGRVTWAAGNRFGVTFGG